MIGKKSLTALLIVGVMASSVPSSAFAHGRGGNGLAIAAGVLGAVAVGSIIANSAQPVYEAPPPRAYYGPPPEQVYYQAAPRYYEPPPVYVREYRRDGYYYHDGYYRH
ncbi:MAG TPA: hypothetical protein VGM52_07830 [Herbaspirillum sp.]|jgi:hypothetical protein